MYKVLKSFCCLLLFSILNLCGVSAVDYLSFNNRKPFNCSKCGKQVMGYLELLDNIKKSNKRVNDSWSFLNNFGITFSNIFPNIFMAVLRSDNRKALMCVDCGSKDMNGQIKSLVEEFCPEFDFQSPRRQDVENLIRNNQFIQKIPVEYRCNLRVFEDGKYVCKICNKGLKGNEIEMFEKGDYCSCFNCGNVFHMTCTLGWEGSCPSCKDGFGIIHYSGNTITKSRMQNFVIWVNEGCPSSSPSKLEFYSNINEADDKKAEEFKDKLQKCETPDAVLELLFPEKVAP